MTFDLWTSDWLAFMPRPSKQNGYQPDKISKSTFENISSKTQSKIRITSCLGYGLWFNGCRTQILPACKVSSKVNCNCFIYPACAVAEWYGAGLATARSCVRISPAAAVHQHQLSMPSLRGQLMCTSESWGVNGHTTRYTSPVSVVLQLRLVPGWGLMKRRSAPPHGP